MAISACSQQLALGGLWLGPIGVVVTMMTVVVVVVIDSFYFQGKKAKVTPESFQFVSKNYGK